MDAAIPIALLGLSTSGKTAIVRSAVNNQSEIFPTAGMEITYISTASKLILAYDCSGEGSVRGNWQMLGGLADCVVFVIDAHNTDTFGTAKKTLFGFLERSKFMR
jgi:GTPase SAR1 family protein